MRKDNLNDFLLITIGILLVAISVVYFFEPNSIAAGGITGLAIVINHYIPFISIGPLVLIMDATLFVIALIAIGPKFGAKSIYCSFLLSTSMWVMQKFFPFTITNDLMLATIFGTLIAALGMAIVFNANASSGGTDTNTGKDKQNKTKTTVKTQVKSKKNASVKTGDSSKPILWAVLMVVAIAGITRSLMLRKKN